MPMLTSRILQAPGLISLLSALVAGCASYDREIARPDRFPPGIPSTAVLVGHGVGKQVFAVIDTGRAYVYDADAARVVVMTHVEPGQRLVLDPQGRKLTLDGVSLFPEFSPPPSRTHAHRIYFDSRDKAATSQPVKSLVGHR